MIVIPSCHCRAVLDSKSAPPQLGLRMQNGYVFIGTFAHKYYHDSFHSDSLPLFLRKLEDKRQSEEQQKQAQHAVYSAKRISWF